MFSILKRQIITQMKNRDEPQEPSIDSEMLDAHLCSIKVCLQEIMNYKTKRFAPTPTHVYWRPVDIEEAWESIKESFANAFRILCKVSTELHVEHKPALPTTSFHEALKTFTRLVEQIDQHIQNTNESQQHSDQQLHHIDDEILQVQYIANNINKFVTKDFEYST